MSPFSFRSFTLSLLFSGAIGLSGCASPLQTPESGIFAPGANITGKGYTYQDNTPLSSPAKTDYWHEDVAFDPVDTQARAESWRYATNDIVSRILDRGLLPTAPIHIQTNRRMNRDNIAFDHFLRESLQTRGYYLTTDPNAPVVFHIHADAPTSDTNFFRYHDLTHKRERVHMYDQEERQRWEEDKEPYVGASHSKGMLRLSITVTENKGDDKEHILTEVEGHYDMWKKTRLSDIPLEEPTVSSVPFEENGADVIVYETNGPQEILPEELKPQPIIDDPAPSVEVNIEEGMTVQKDAYTPMTYQIETEDDAVIQPLN